MVKKSILAIMVAMFSLSAFAQQVDEVTLTVSGDGATKEMATQVALRSAIEQAFGVFVSANTQILNDELVKDEIATVSSGNIKNYEEITAITLANGNISVTLKAIVSVSKLRSYAQSKGSSAEFAGATFGMNMKLKELNKANEEKAIENLIAQLEALSPSLFDYKLELGEPRLGKRNKEIYELPVTVYVLYNDNTKMANRLLLKTLASLALSEEEKNENVKLGIGYAYMRINNHYDFYYWQEMRCYGTQCPSNMKAMELFFRSSLSVSMLIEYVRSLENSIINFKIVDNTGGESTIEHNGGERIRYTGLISPPEYLSYNTYEIYDKISPNYLNKTGGRSLYIPHLVRKLLFEDICYRIFLTLAIPKEDIMKYNNFTITRK